MLMTEKGVSTLQTANAERSEPQHDAPLDPRDDLAPITRIDVVTASPPPMKAVMALAETPDADIACPWCAREGVADGGRLKAYEQRVGEVRIIHIWCTRSEDHTTCITGARDTVFQGVPDVSERDASASDHPQTAANVTVLRPPAPRRRSA